MLSSTVPAPFHIPVCKAQGSSLSISSPTLVILFFPFFPSFFLSPSLPSLLPPFLPPFFIIAILKGMK